MSDDQYYVSEKGEKDKSIALPFGSVYDTPTSSAVQFSPKGDYIYYLGEYDADDDAGTLWRCQYINLAGGSICKLPGNGRFRSYFVYNRDGRYRWRL